MIERVLKEAPRMVNTTTASNFDENPRETYLLCRPALVLTRSVQGVAQVTTTTSVPCVVRRYYLPPLFSICVTSRAQWTLNLSAKLDIGTRFSAATANRVLLRLEHERKDLGLKEPNTRLLRRGHHRLMR